MDRAGQRIGGGVKLCLPICRVTGKVRNRTRPNAPNAPNLNCDRFRRVPAKPNEPKYKVGDRIQITLNNKIVEATITAIVQRTDGLRLQVSYGRDLTAPIYEWQIVKGK